VKHRSAILALTLLLSGLGWTSSSAQAPAGAKSEGTPPGGPGDDSTATGGGRSGSKAKPSFLYLRDGGKLSCWPRLDFLSVDTAYGALKIPLQDLLRIRFSRRWNQADLQKAEEAMKLLGSDDFDERESAMKTLRQLGSAARGILRQALKSDDLEVKTRSEALLLEIGSSEPAEQSHSEEGIEPLRGTDEDEIITVRFSIKGRVAGEAFTVGTLYGDLEVKYTDILGVGFHSDAPVSATVNVPGTTTVPESWLDTKCSVSKGDKVILRASGQLSISNYNLTAGPEGTTRYRTSGTPYSNFPTLSLIGKIGKNGKPFLVGQKHESRARSDGTLYLGIVPFRRGYVAAGSFQVKIDGER
jgi:hypothetical protein